MTASSALLAAWLGLQTSILPCPLATNIAAVSFLGRKAGESWQIFAAGLLYTAGRAATYVLLAFLLVQGVCGRAGTANFLEAHMNRALGPILILAGMFLLDMLELPDFGLGRQSQRMQSLAERLGLFGALPLGALFALAFCPPAAALYFLALIPLCLKAGSSLILPGIYGIGTALPVVAFAFLLAFGARFLGQAFGRLTRIEKLIRAAAGVVFVVVGIYFALTYIFRLFA